jgi:hypothetical protein
MLSSAEEIQFWTGIMRDHGEFISSSLSYKEQAAINTALYYKETFSLLHEQSGKPDAKEIKVSEGEMPINLMKLVAGFINFKRFLLRRLLECQLDTSLAPSFYNHMLNEALDFYRIICKMSFSMPQNVTLELLELHRLWLRDASGHAATIACQLDMSEELLIEEARNYKQCFDDLWAKAEELEKMLLRACLTDGVLMRLSDEARMKMVEFMCYLEKIKRLLDECTVMSVMKPLIPDHMLREENYYFNKIEAYEKMLLEIK